MYYLFISACVIICFSKICAFNFDIKNVHYISQNNNSYFGYAVLLQKGFQPSVIVGAPRNNLGLSGGSVYSCTLEGKCSKHNIYATSANTPNGNFLGSALDGGENTEDPLIVCAPRLVRSTTISPPNFFLDGWCSSRRNSSSNNSVSISIIKPLEKEPSISLDGNTGMYFYDYGFGQAGLDLHYMQDSRTVLLGAPGIKGWNGAIVVQSLTKLSEYKVIPTGAAPIKVENDGYLGYTVTSARFESTRRTISYIAGAPRAADLHGNVKIYNPNGRLLTTLTGDELGSYFGSSILAADLNNDRLDDLLVGAPLGSGTTWDEGYVYFYRRDGFKLVNPLKLVGGSKTVARFGSSIVSLGDIDLDSYNDVAISAPYEDDGTGAVYIYMGSKTGISPIYSQRLSPREFPGVSGSVRGFGQGLSRGVDIDGNGHNDLAVGAYKSGHVFVLKTISVVDYRLSLFSNITTIPATAMNATFCIYYTQRSKTKVLTSVLFRTQLVFDYRVQATNITDVVDVALFKEYCKSVDLKITSSPLDISPFKMTLTSEIQQSNVFGIGENQIEKSIPYSHGCGDDDVCQTWIRIEVLTNLEHIILGLNKEMVVTLSAENVGEPGYGCNLFFNFSSALELRDSRDCNIENGTYMCPISSRLISNYETEFKFDIKIRNPELKKIYLNFALKCLGKNMSPDANKYDLILDVLLKNSPYIQGSSVPNNFYFDDENMKDNEMSHVFMIGNSGPSPVKLNIFFLFPSLKKDGVDIFEIEAKGSLNGIEFQCHPTNDDHEEKRSYDVQSLLTEPLNKTIVIDCFEEGVGCTKLSCDAEYLQKTTEVAEYKVKIITRINLLASNYYNELRKKDMLVYISTAYLYSSDDKRIEAQSSTIIFASSKKPIPLWIYIVGALIGVLLLGLLIFLMYKCHFFDRNYRDKMKGEILMDTMENRPESPNENFQS